MTVDRRMYINVPTFHFQAKLKRISMATTQYGFQPFCLPEFPVVFQILQVMRTHPDPGPDNLGRNSNIMIFNVIQKSCLPRAKT